MPVDVPVGGSAAEAQDVRPLGRDDLAHRLGDAVHDPLELEVLVELEIRRDLLSMLARRDEHRPEQRGKRAEKRDRPVVLVHDVVRVLRVPRDDGADEAPRRDWRSVVRRTGCDARSEARTQGAPIADRYRCD